MLKKRDEKRVPFRKLIICKCGEEMHPAFTQDVSQHGIGIQTIQRPSLFRRVRIALAVGNESIFLDGEVRWAHEYAGPLAAKPKEIGIFIDKPSADYLRLVADCSDRSQPRPQYSTLK
ncbi:MAG: PilZ domain-containing protein [Candidatus Aminicenantes bacterium]|nr:PilZ domain-containing protein [Candidatus Aminicenantes bacterium]